MSRRRKTRGQMDAEIAAATPLSRSMMCPSDRLAGCNVCGKPAEEFDLYLEHGAGDLPPPEDQRRAALVYLGRDHRDCLKVLEAHPRLYAQVRGDPGHFPLLCGPCQNRREMSCTHPDLKANGGAGLNVSLLDPLRGVIACNSRGRIKVVHTAMNCVGRVAIPGQDE